MFESNVYLPTRIIFGVDKLSELSTIKLPGKKALLCVTSDGLMEKIGIQQKVIEYLSKNNTEVIIYNEVCPNPTKSSVEKAVRLAKSEGCDFVIGLGGGSSIDTAKAAAIMLVNDGNLWDYAYTGTGGKKIIEKAAPIVTISTTSGTGTETDCYCVITNEETDEKLDFATEAIFPTISIIDARYMLSLPKSLTIYQGFDALFHAAECYIANGHKNKMVDLYAKESIKIVSEYLPKVLENTNDLESRNYMAFAADILSGYTQSLVSVTSHHIIAQTLGGYYPSLAHGASLIVIAEEYYTKASKFLPELFDEIGELMGINNSSQDGMGFVYGIKDLMKKTGANNLKMSEFGITRKDFDKIVNMTVEEVGIGLDRYTLTKEDIYDILEKSYK